MSRIQLTDNGIDIIMKMVEGNPGAISVLTTLIKEEPKIDPDSFLAGFGTILSMDEMGIYGTHIWILYKYSCGQNVLNLITLFRAHQLGFVTSESIKSASTEAAASSREPSFDFTDLFSKIKTQLPDFGG